MRSEPRRVTTTVVDPRQQGARSRSGRSDGAAQRVAADQAVVVTEVKADQVLPFSLMPQQRLNLLEEQLPLVVEIKFIHLQLQELWLE